MLPRLDQSHFHIFQIRQDWPTSRLANSQFDRLTDWQNRRLAKFDTREIINYLLIGEFAARNWPTHRLTNYKIGQLTDQFTNGRISDWPTKID